MLQWHIHDFKKFTPAFLPAYNQLNLLHILFSVRHFSSLSKKRVEVLSLRCVVGVVYSDRRPLSGIRVLVNLIASQIRRNEITVL